MFKMQSDEEAIGEYSSVPLGEESERDTAVEVAGAEVSAVKQSELLINEDTPSLERVWIFLKQSAPVICNFVVGISLSFFTQYFAGHMELNGDKTVIFAGVALASLFYNVTCRSLMIGLASAVDTLASQNNGAQNYREVGIVVQRSYAIQACACIFLLPLWFFADSIFAVIGVEKLAIIVLRNFLRLRLLGLPVDIFLAGYERYMMSVGEMDIPMLTSCTIGAIMLTVNIIMTTYFDVTYWALALSQVGALYIGGVFMFLLSRTRQSVIRTLQPFSKEAFTQWGEYLGLAIPGTLMLCAEWWAWEILAVFASLISTEAVAAQTIMMQLSSVTFMVPLGLSITTCSMVGNSLGAQKKQLAIEISKLSYTMLIILESSIIVLIFVFGGAFIRMFALDEEVRQLGYQMLPFLMLLASMDAIQCVGTGILRGCGKQMFGAVVNLTTYYLIGLPMAWFLCFHANWGVKGLVAGNSIATVAQALLFTGLIFGYESYCFTTSIVHVEEEEHLCSQEVVDLNISREEGDVEMQIVPKV